jgi:hypothetical protein
MKMYNAVNDRVSRDLRLAKSYFLANDILGFSLLMNESICITLLYLDTEYGAYLLSREV